jgi:hypothetical protein
VRLLLVICSLIIGVNAAITLVSWRDASKPPPAPVCPPTAECHKQTPDEYRDELVSAARDLGWVCHRHEAHPEERP